MIKYLKLKSNHIIVKFILGIIILSLLLSSLNSYFNQDVKKYIATVNGEKISFDVFQKMYFIEREKQKKILGKNFFKLSKNKKFIKETYNHVLSQLINNVLLEQYVKKLNLQTSDYEIKEIILNSPIFQKNKKFNKELYFNYLVSNNLTNHEYINIIKKKINTEHLIHTIANSNFILEDEQKKIIKLLSQKRTIKQAIIKTKSVVYKQNATDSEAKNYFNQNRNNFYIPENFKVNFVQLRTNQFKTYCNNKEIYNWYLKNIEKYSIKEKRRYSIIQTKTKKEAFQILSNLHNQPESFSKIAQEKSTDLISAKKGGDIGWISIDLIPNEIKNAHLNKENQISNIIPFNNEFLIIKLNQILVGKHKKIHEVSNIIKNKIKYIKSLHLYNKLKNKISDFIKNKPDQIELILKENNISIQETNWFDKKSIPKILNIPILKKIIFNKKLFKKNKMLKPYFHFIILNNNQSFLISLKDFKNKKMQTFQNVKQDIIKKLKFIKATKEIEKQSKKIIYELKQEKTDLFQKLNLHFTNSEVISRYDTNPITSMVFSLPHPEKRKKTYALYKNKNKDFVIICLEKIHYSNFSQAEKNIIIEYLEKNNTEMIFNSILKDIRKKSTIIYENIENI